MLLNRCLLLLVIGAGLGTIPERAFAARGELKAPSVATSATYPAAHREQLLNVLKPKDCKFIKGSWLNSFTNLHYHSDTKALGQFLNELAKCPGVTVSISFYRPGKDARWAPEGSNWSVFHDAHSNRFQVKIRLDSDEIDITSLYIPPLKGE